MFVNQLQFDPDTLRQRVQKAYGFDAVKVRLYRQSGGQIYYLDGPKGRRVLKIYLPQHTVRAVQSTRIMAYLEACGYPVVHVIPTFEGVGYILLDTPQGACAAILYAYAKGACIGFLHQWRDGGQVHPETQRLGRQFGRLHRLMDGYSGPLSPQGKEDYIDPLIDLLRQQGCDAAVVEDLADYGRELWAALEGTPAGFVHGDAHTGNTALHNGKFALMDFDRAAFAHPVLDVGALADGTDFNRFDKDALARTEQVFDALYAGYSQERTLTRGEIRAVFDSVAIRHYDLIIAGVRDQGHPLSPALVAEQHDWLMRWRELCLRR